MAARGSGAGEEDGSGLRGLKPEERDAVISLWVEVFSDDSGEFFGRYFEADPEVRDADCHVAVVGGRLASAVHVCRRRLLWEGREVLCGAVANVATRSEYRRQGLSRALLRRALAAMEAEGFAFSMLLTGSPRHYAAVGWEEAPVPERALRRIEAPPPERSIREVPATPIPVVVRALYDAPPLRPLHQLRPDLYWDGWVQRYWSYGTAPTLLLAGGEATETGYAVLAAQPHRGAATLREMRALDAGTERDLLRAACGWSRARGHATLWLSFVPQHLTAADLRALGDVAEEWDDGLMLRPITLSTREMEDVRAAYTSGGARLWWADDF